MKTAVKTVVPLLACALLSFVSTRSIFANEATVEAAETSVGTRPKIYTMPFQTLAIGARSGCERAAKMLISDEREWQRVWGLHATAAEKAELPAIDWSRQAVVVLLMGQVSGDASTAPAITLHQVVHTPHDTVVYFQEAPATKTKTAAPAVQPFHFALIDKPVTPLRFVNLSAERCDTCVLGLKP
jgi:hypothetical protein